MHFPLSLSRRDDPSGSLVVYFSETHMIVVRYFTLPLYTTDRNRTDDRLIWTGPEPVPAIGDTVMVRFNNIGECSIVCFASQGPYLGLLVLARLRKWVIYSVIASSIKRATALP